MSETLKFRTGRTTRMVAEAYYQALKWIESGEYQEPFAGKVYVFFTNTAEAQRWIRLLEEQFNRPLPPNLLLVGRDRHIVIIGSWAEYKDHAVKYQQFLSRGIPPWKMNREADWPEYTEYDIENTPLELSRPKSVNPSGVACYQSVYDLVMQMRLSAGDSAGCGSEEHF